MAQERLAVAERRIEEARRADAECLDLGDLDLSELPSSLGDLSPLKALYLGKGKPGGSGDVYSRQPRISDLRPLAHLRNLEQLDLRGCASVTDLSPLIGLRNLKSLELTGCEGVSDLSALAAMLRLETVSLAKCKVGDLRPLSHLMSLRSIDLSDSRAEDLSPLSGLQCLQSLTLSHCWVEDLAPLTRLPRLEHLHLVGCHYLKDVTPVGEMSGLRKLSLSSTRLSGLTEVSRLHTLEHLGLGSKDVEDLWLLHGLRTLHSLALIGIAADDLSPLSGLSALELLRIMSCKEVTDLSPLSGLSALQEIRVDYCDSITDLSPLSGLPALREIRIESCNGVTTIPPLAARGTLRTISFHWSKGLHDISGLSGLKALTSLDLELAKMSSLSPIAELEALKELKLGGCENVTDLSPLATLKSLEHLGLSSTSVVDLSPLSSLEGLLSLDLAHCKGVTDLSPLRRLHRLKSLTLGQGSVTDLSPLSELRDLETLSAWGLQGVADLSPLRGLDALRQLDLTGSSVHDLTPLSGLERLEHLSLGGCEKVRDLAPLSQLRQLVGLSLSQCTALTDLTPLEGLDALEGVNLFGCRAPIPQTLQNIFAGHPRLVSLVADAAVGVPREVLSQDGRDNCLPRLCTHLAELDLGADTDNEVKVILLGNGSVGKTQLCRRFRGDTFDESIGSTHGVQICRQELRLRRGDRDRVFRVNWWDFGGQDIYHGTHALFLRSRAVFLILWTPRLENRDEYHEGRIALRNQPLAYWLEYVRTLAGRDSAVIIVQSQCDRLADLRPFPPPPDGFGFFRTCAYSAKEDLGRADLTDHLHDALCHLTERSGALAIGSGRARVRQQLYDWRDEDQRRPPAERRHRTLTLTEFQSLCDAAGGIISWEHGLDYFHQTGVVFHRPDLFSNCIILDQDWALDAIYTLFDRRRTASWLRESGRFTREDLALMVWSQYSTAEQELFLGLMESCGVCFRTARAADGQAAYVAPDLLPSFSPVAPRLLAWRENEDTPVLRLVYRFLHPAVIRELMSRVGRKAGDLAEYWKYGFWLKDAERDSQLLVQAEDTPSRAQPGAGELVLRAQGSDPLGLLREIRRALLRRQSGDRPEERLTLADRTVERSALATTVGGRVLDIDGRPVEAAPFAAFFGEGEPPAATPAAHTDEPEIHIQPAPLSPSDKPKEVFISYAWGDDTPEGKRRAQAVEGLCAALARDGFQPVLDRDHIRPGELISAFMRRLTHADLVVAVISDKYLRSPHCMYEIYRLWQRSQADADDLLRHLVPIVLPDVKIGNVRERLPYMEHWADQAESLESLIRNPKLRPGPESWEEVRLVRKFAEDVDSILVFVNDILMPRKLNVHFEDGFETVRAALRRRMEPA